MDSPLGKDNLKPEDNQRRQSRSASVSSNRASSAASQTFHRISSAFSSLKSSTYRLARRDSEKESEPRLKSIGKGGGRLLQPPPGRVKSASISVFNDGDKPSTSKGPQIQYVTSPNSVPTSPSVLVSRVRLLSPKMQRQIRINENQILMLADKARKDHKYSGFLSKRSSETNRWQNRWFTLYQNLLFYSEVETSTKPLGVILLEGSYCERLIDATSSISTALPSKAKDDQQYCFAITYRREHQRQYDLKAETEHSCKTWIEMIRHASFNKLLLQKEELEQKHLHLLQIVESEKMAKWQYTQQCEELTSEIKKLRSELCTLKKEWRVSPPRRLEDLPDDSEEIRKIKKVQSFFRGWLCRRRWKQIVEEYIQSPQAESMRKRNNLVFKMVEAEEEYVEQLNLLISYFQRPFKMAASSKKPPCSHEDVNSIFLNSETLLFLHQIFLKGLSARMESWPTLVLDSGKDDAQPKQSTSGSSSTIRLLSNTNLGDLFDMLLPMLSIYQEYVRNHHYSLQVLAECKQSVAFTNFLNKLEVRPALMGRSLETFLTYPMHQIPRYIITLHELLAHTPHNHVERKSLDHARIQLEDLSRQMHDEVSETENIRKNLAIERMIVEGCDILLDVNQMFVRQGKKPSTTKTLSSCFTKEQTQNFTRRSIDFPKINTELFINEDSEEPRHTPRSQRSHSTISYLSREQQLASIGHRRRLSSLRQNSLVNSSGGLLRATTGTATSATGSIVSVNISTVGSQVSALTTLVSAPVGITLATEKIDSTNNKLDTPRSRKKCVRITNDSFDEEKELCVVQGQAATLQASQTSVEMTPDPSPTSSTEEMFFPFRRISNLESVEENISTDSNNEYC